MSAFLNLELRRSRHFTWALITGYFVLTEGCTMLCCYIAYRRGVIVIWTRFCKPLQGSLWNFTNQRLWHRSAFIWSIQPEESENLFLYMDKLSVAKGRCVFCDGYQVAKCPVDWNSWFLLPVGELGVGGRGHSLPPDFSPQARGFLHRLDAIPEGGNGIPKFSKIQTKHRYCLDLVRVNWV